METKPKELLDFCKENFTEIRVIGHVNPSIIIILKGKGHVVYESPGHHDGKYALVCGSDRVYFNDPNDLKRLIK